MDKKEKKLIKDMLDMIKVNEWQTRHAAENRYCPYCEEPSDYWYDQKEHHKGCKFVSIVNRAEDLLKGNK